MCRVGSRCAWKGWQLSSSIEPAVEIFSIFCLNGQNVKEVADLPVELSAPGDLTNKQYCMNNQEGSTLTWLAGMWGDDNDKVSSVTCKQKSIFDPDTWRVNALLNSCIYCITNGFILSSSMYSSGVRFTWFDSNYTLREVLTGSKNIVEEFNNTFIITYFKHHFFKTTILKTQYIPVLKWNDNDLSIININVLPSLDELLVTSPTCSDGLCLYKCRHKFQ